MKEVPISDLVDEKISGEWGVEPSNGLSIKVLRTTNFTNEGKLKLDSVVEREIDRKIVDRKRLKYGDTIIEKSGGSPNQPVGRVVLFDLDTDEPFLCNNFTAILRPTKDVNPRYFFWSLFSKHLNKSTLRYQNKTTGILNLKLERYLEEEKIKLPDLKTQQKIAGILEQADAARQKRKQSNQLTEQFLQSAFLEMFGDFRLMIPRYEIKKLGEIAERVTDGEHTTPIRQASGIKLLSARNIKNGYFDFEAGVDYIGEDEYNRMNKRVKPQLNDVLLSCSGTIGRVLTVKINEPFQLVRSVALIRINQDVLHPVYLEYLLRSDYGQFEIDKRANKSSQANIFTNPIKDIPIVIPPLPLQQKFAALVEQVERLRAKQRESERELDNLFQSLMQKYFG
ncbi:MAG: restriction endonuclease subunit S [Cytophagales bacterium]|jgi:type I restriction enzyme S subunit|nr:restriction endonuclease subunit S [Cytophagales bacterium]